MVPEENLDWFLKLALSGAPDAQNQVGMIYESDAEEMTPNLKVSLHWYGKAAEQGHDGAQYNLGRMLFHGLGITQDRDRGLEWIQKSAAQGFADAQLFLGLCYEEGNGVPQSYSQAADGYRKAAEQGKEVAQYHLANLYKKGQGVEKNMDEAVKWFRRAAEREYLPAVGSLKKILHHKSMFPGISDDDSPSPGDR
jgi:TPR repeat protein